MKRVGKGSEPATLTAYRRAVPTSDWEQMRNDGPFNGRQAYQDCRQDTIADQKGLCAFCEMDIRSNNPMYCRVEHFHAKSDRSTGHNWALDWNNMLAVCNGGDNPHAGAPGFFRLPMIDNLSCDAHKNHMVQTGNLPKACEGLILNPLHLPALPSLFCLDKSTGELKPDHDVCATVKLDPPGVQKKSTSDRVQHTIDMLNLNCDRLTENRLRIIRDVEKNKKRQRVRGYNAQQGLDNLARKYFRQAWPGYFSTILLCLGEAGQRYLRGKNYSG